jgi:TatA/E family protein of Tat protein translocase
MPTPGPLELVVILVIALLILGPGKLPDVGAALGKSLREFRKASSDIQESVKVDTSPLPPDAAAPAAPATTAPAAQAAPSAPVAPAAAATVTAVTAPVIGEAQAPVAAEAQAAAPAPAAAPPAPAPIAADAPMAAPPAEVVAAESPETPSDTTASGSAA